MKDAANDTATLDELNSKLSQLSARTNSLVQNLSSQLEKSRQLLEGTQFSRAEECVKTAVSANKIVCEEIKKVQEYIFNLKALIVEYSRLKF